MTNNETLETPDAELEETQDQPVDEAEHSEESPADQQKEKPAPEFVTRAELNAMLNEQQKRIVQSTTDRVSNRIQADLKNLTAVLEFQKKQGVQITPQQEAAMRDAVIREAYAEGKPNADPSRQMQEYPEGEPYNPVAAEIANIMRLEGVPILDSDPEFENIETILQGPPNPAALRRALYEAIDAKRERLTTRKATAKARVLPSGSQTSASKNDISKITDSDELYAMAEQDLVRGRRDRR